jgi:hypothetical protein
MEITEEYIKCNSASKDFKVVKYTFSENIDELLLKDFSIKAELLAENLNPALARDSYRTRDKNTLYTNALAGVVSEFCWIDQLNKKSIKENKNLIISSTEYKDVKNQIDVLIKDGEKNLMHTAEVRSSFPYTGIKNGICKVFDIIGWYENYVKINEVKKEYYLRALFPYRVEEFKLKYNIKFDVYLAGGATMKDLEDNPNAKYKIFNPYYEKQYKTSTKYRVIEPIINASDTSEIINKILNFE